MDFFTSQVEMRNNWTFSALEMQNTKSFPKNLKSNQKFSTLSTFQSFLRLHLNFFVFTVKTILNLEIFKFDLSFDAEIWEKPFIEISWFWTPVRDSQRLKKGPSSTSQYPFLPKWNPQKCPKVIGITVYIMIYLQWSFFVVKLTGVCWFKPVDRAIMLNKYK